MNTNLRALGFLVVAAVATWGCKPKDAGGAEAGAAPSAGAPAVACPAGQLAVPGPSICIAVPPGYTPLNAASAKEATGGSMQVSYSSDGTSGGKFVAVVQITYNAASPSPPNFKYLEDDAKEYCDAPPKIEDIAGGKGKFFSCTSKKLEGHVYTKSKTFTAKNVIDCSSQSVKKPEIDTVCKTLKQL